MYQTLLSDRDYTIILARNSSNEFAIPELEEQWQIAEQSIVTLAKKCEDFNPDGLTLYVATHPIQKYERQTDKTLPKIFKQQYVCYNVNLLIALKAAIDDYFNRRAKGQTKRNGEIIIMVLDLEPRNHTAAIKLLVQATKKMNCRDELKVVFAQVGDNALTKGFLKVLDNNLELAGAKFDIADSKAMQTMDDNAAMEFLLCKANK